MQKRPNVYSDRKIESEYGAHDQKLELQYVEYELDDVFPVSEINTDMHMPDTQPITFLHYHNCFEIGYCYEGSGVFAVNEKLLPFSKGDVSVIFGNQVHIAKSDPLSPSRWIFVYIDLYKLLMSSPTEDVIRLSTVFDGNSGIPNIVKGSEYPEITRTVYEIIEELKNESDLYELTVKGLAIRLAVELYRISSTDGVSEASGQSVLKDLSPAINYIAGNYNKEIKIDNLAKLCMMSPTGFRRNFRRAMSMPPSEYIYQFRNRMALIRLRDCNTSILDVSISVGYNSLSSFNRHFKRITGMSPSEWRRRHIE